MLTIILKKLCRACSQNWKG